MPVPAEVVIGSQDDDCQRECRDLFRSVAGALVLKRLPIYHGESNHYIIMTIVAA